MRQFLPRHLTERAAALPHKATAPTVRLEAVTGQSRRFALRKNIVPFRRRATVKYFTDVPIGP
jgi:hypothetical protein